MIRRHRIAAFLAILFLSQAAWSQPLLLIPDSGNDRIWAFDPFNGDLVNNNLIPGGGNLDQPINAIDSGHGTILVTDETADRVQEFNYNGSYVGVFADATDGLDGPFGITRFGNQVYVASNVNGQIVRLDDNGQNATVWASGFGTPRDIIFRQTDALVSESANDDILQFGLSGNLLGTFHNSDGVSGIDFPQQMQLESNGNVLAAGFTAPLGIYEYNSAGTQVNAFTNLVTSPRGVYRLGNGKLLYAGGTRVMRYDTSTMMEETVINQAGTSFRFIELSNVPEPSLGLLAIITLWCAGGLRRQIAD